MTITQLTPPLAGLNPITLDELLSRAALQTRVDRKYVLPLVDIPPLLRAIATSSQVLQIGTDRSFAYQSVYYDTPDLACYRLSAHRRRHRFKVRTRTYLDSDQCWLEVKTTGRNGTTVKHRTGYPYPAERQLGMGRCFVETVLPEPALTILADQTLIATLTTWYQRSTLYLPSSNSRVTIDTTLTWADRGQQTMGLAELAIVETKTATGGSPVDRWLWSHGRRPTRISKYSTCLAALRPALPATRWRATLRRYFPTTNLTS